MTPSTITARANDRTAAPSLVAEIRGVFAAIRQRWLWVLIAMALALGLGLLALLLITPRYTSTAQILIDPRAKRIVEGAVVPGGYGSSAAGADTLLVDSQVELIQSNVVLRKIVEAEKLHKDSEFAVPASTGGLRMLLRNTIGRTLFGNDREVAPATDDIDTAVWRFGDRHLRVRRLGNTYVIAVSVMSSDPVKSARLANLIAQAYISDQVRATGDTTREATAALQSRIVDLGKRVEVAENAVEAFRTKAGLIGSPNLLVTEQQLQQTNDKLILARSQAAIAKARYDQVRELSVRGGTALIGAQSDALKSPVIANLRAALSRVERREAVIQQTLRPGHPEYAGAQIEKRAVLTQIEEELSRIKANARGEFELAQAGERTLAGELKTLEGATANGNQSQVRLRELQREAQSARAIYEQFLNRAKETSEQESLGRENSRIISEATVPPYPSFPPTLLILGSSLAVGLLAGTASAWLAHLFSTPHGLSPPAAQPAMADAGRIDTARPTRIRRLKLPPQLEAVVDVTAITPKVSRPGAASLAQADVLETLARLPAIAKRSLGAIGRPGNVNGNPAVEAPNFADHIAAVDDMSAAAYPGYQDAIDQLLADLGLASSVEGLMIALLVGTQLAAGTSSTALALAYRSAVKGRRTLLVDVSASEPSLSHVFAANLRQRRACVLDSETHLSEITLRDTRTGLTLLPLALADIINFNAEQQRRLITGLRQLARRFDLVILDAGSATDNQGVSFLATLADKVLIVHPTSTMPPAATQRLALDAANRFQTRAAAAVIIETSAR